MTTIYDTNQQGNQKAGVNNIRLNLSLDQTLTQTELQEQTDSLGLISEIHWLRLQAEAISENDWRDLGHLLLDIDDHLWSVGDCNVKIHKKDKGYNRKAEGELGQYICWTKDGDKYRCAIVLTGSWLETQTTLQNIQLLDELTRYGFDTTRIDLAVNDFSKELEFQDIFEAVNAGNFKGFINKRAYLSGEKDCWNGWTIYCGSRESESMTRFYETYQKHGYLANRIECEFKGEKARNVVGYLLQVYNDNLKENNVSLYYGIGERVELGSLMAKEFAYLAIGQIDFIDRTDVGSNGCVKDCPRLAFWHNFIERVGQALKVKVARAKATLKQRGSWVKRAWEKTLGVLFLGLGEDQAKDVLTLLACSGIERMDEEDEKWAGVLLRDGISAIFA